MIRKTAAALLLMAGVLQPAAAQQAVTRQQVDDRKAVIATVEPVRELPARARIGGTIVALSVREGDQVAAGDRIALVVDPKLALQIQALESRIQAQNAAREQAQIDFNRMQQLRGSGTVSQAQLDQVRTRQHWNSANIKPVDPVTLGLSTQLELDAVVRKAADKRAKEAARRGEVEPEGATLRPASETGAAHDEQD